MFHSFYSSSNHRKFNIQQIRKVIYIHKVGRNDDSFQNKPLLPKIQINLLTVLSRNRYIAYFDSRFMKTWFLRI